MTTRRLARSPQAWLDHLIDPESFVPIQPSAPGYAYGPEVLAGLARIGGRPAALYATDPGVDRGFVSSRGAEKIRRTMDRAADLGVPVVALLASPGVSVDEGLASGDAYTRVIAGNVALSGVVPQLAAIMGPTMGAPAYSATLMDLMVFSRTRSHLMVTGPAVVERMLGQRTTLEALGGAALHAEETGLAHFVEADAAAQLDRIRALLALLPSNRLEDAPRFAPTPPAAPLPPVPAGERDAFDMATLLAGLVDASALTEVLPASGPSLITAFAHLDGWPVGVVANQSLHHSGAIDADAARKAARFIRLCDAYHVPILTIIDVPGFLPGQAQEARGLLRYGAQLCAAMQTGAPRLSVVVRRCYGAAAFLMMQTRAQDGDVVLALEGARIAVMGFDAGRALVYPDGAATGAATGADDDADAAALRERYHRDYEAPANAYAAGLIDEIVAPAALRERLATHLAWLSRRRERPAVPRRHPILP